jgi:hypothetical protein
MVLARNNVLFKFVSTHLNTTTYISTISAIFYKLHARCNSQRLEPSNFLNKRKCSGISLEIMKMVCNYT